MVPYKNNKMIRSSIFESDLSKAVNNYFSYYDDFDLIFTSVLRKTRKTKKDKMDQRKRQTSHK